MVTLHPGDRRGGGDAGEGARASPPMTRWILVKRMRDVGGKCLCKNNLIFASKIPQHPFNIIDKIIPTGVR